MELPNSPKSFSAKLKLPALYLLIWLISGIAIGANAYRFVPHYQNFVNRGIQTEGKVTGISVGEFADSVHYTYKVDEIEFTGDGLAGSGNPETGDLKVGNKIIIFYDSQNVKSSVPGNPKLLLNYQIRHTWLSAILGSSMTIVFILIGRSGLKWIQQNGMQPSETL